MLALHDKQALFSKSVAKFIWDLNELGYQVTLGEAWRPKQVAAIYAQQGKGITRSLHIQRLAIDLNIFRDGVWLDAVDTCLPAGRLWESYQITDILFCWGGRFQSPDIFHFSFEDGGIR